MIAVVVCAALAAFALVYTLWVPASEVYVAQPPSPLDHLLDKKRVIYDNLRDLSFEYRTGKLSDEDYQKLKSSLQYEMATVMKSIEDAGDSAGTGIPARPGGQECPSPLRTCSSCGHANPPDHKHCSECGARLAAVVAGLLLLLAALPGVSRVQAMPPAATTGRITVQGAAQNLTIGKPASNLAVKLIRAGETKEPIGQATTDAKGGFRFEAVDVPAPPARRGGLLVQAEHGGVRYTEPVTGSEPITLNIYEPGAPAASIHLTERAVILQPGGGKLLVNELYSLRNDSKPPATYAPADASFRFFIPEGGRGNMQVAAQGAGGMPLPVQSKADASAEGVMSVGVPLKPGENRIAISYSLDYPGSLLFQSRTVGKVERTRLAVAPGVTVEGKDVRLIGTEPQMKFGIYEVAGGEPWSVKLAGESSMPPAAAPSEGAETGGGAQDAVFTQASAVGQRLYPLLGTILLVLAAGFFRLWKN